MSSPRRASFRTYRHEDATPIQRRLGSREIAARHRKVALWADVRLGRPEVFPWVRPHGQDAGGGALGIDAFHARYWNLRLEQVTSDRFLDLPKGKADIAIRAHDSQAETLVDRKIADALWAV
jgi:hypothetical protein